MITYEELEDGVDLAGDYARDILNGLIQDGHVITIESIVDMNFPNYTQYQSKRIIYHMFEISDVTTGIPLIIYSKESSTMMRLNRDDKTAMRKFR